MKNLRYVFSSQSKNLLLIPTFLKAHRVIFCILTILKACSYVVVVRQSLHQ